MVFSGQYYRVIPLLYHWPGIFVKDKSMNEVRPGDKIIKSAEDHNNTARVVNHFKQYGLPAPLPANGGNRSSVSRNGSGAAVSRYWIMAISADLFAPAEVEDALDPACQFAQRVQYELVTVDPTTNQFLCVTEQLIDKDGYGLVTLSGVVQLRIDIKDAAHKYANLKNPQPTATEGQPAQLESAATGTFRIVSQPAGSTGEQWCTAFFPASGPNVHADDARSAYTIDRTAAADDAKAWNPADSLPADWADYDCVTLVVGYLRYDPAAGTLEQVVQEYHYSASNAPVIPAATVTAANTGSC